MSPERFGRDVLGPIVAEFCLRLWTLAASLDRPQDATLLFCARGGLRMQLAYEHFLAASGLPSTVPVRSLMVSRLAAVRPALMRSVTDAGDTLVPAAAAALTYEFSGMSVADVARAVSGHQPVGGQWDVPFTPAGLVELLAHEQGRPVVDALTEQSDLFTRHLHDCLDGRRHAILVDTGLYGTTQSLLREALPDLQVSSVLLARTFRPIPGGRSADAVGLSVTAHEYSPLDPRTALLRYWHFIEWLFEPALSSVRTFSVEGGIVRSNLQVPGWQDRVAASPGTAFAGVMAYLDALGPAPGERIAREAGPAWRAYHRAVVWPRAEHADALAVDTRSHDFGREETWSAPPPRGPVAVLRSDSMWREGELARSGTPWRRPLLAGLEVAYGVRAVSRSATRALGRRGVRLPRRAPALAPAPAPTSPPSATSASSGTP